MTEEELNEQATKWGDYAAVFGMDFPSTEADWKPFFDLVGRPLTKDEERVYTKAFASSYAHKLVSITASPSRPGIAPAVTDMEKLSEGVMKQIEGEMDKRGLTRKWLADEMGVTPGYVSHLFVGRKRNMTLDTLVKMADALGMSVDINIS